jgi:hypothetical protein
MDGTGELPTTCDVPTCTAKTPPQRAVFHVYSETVAALRGRIGTRAAHLGSLVETRVRLPGRDPGSTAGVRLIRRPQLATTRTLFSSESAGSGRSIPFARPVRR